MSAPRPRQIACTRVVLPVPRSPEKPIAAGASRLAPSVSPNRLSASWERCWAPVIGLRLELEDLITQQRRPLEVECFGGGLQLLLEQADQGVALARVVGARRGGGGLGRLGIGEACREPHLIHRLDDRSGRDALG